MEKYVSNNSPDVMEARGRRVGGKKTWFPRSPALPSGSRRKQRKGFQGAECSRTFGNNLTNGNVPLGLGIRVENHSGRGHFFDENDDGTPRMYKNSNTGEELSPGEMEAGILRQPFFSLNLNDEPDADYFPGTQLSRTGGDVHPEIRIWVPDSQVTSCYECDCKFSLVGKRRHHCRKCGRVYCHQCCSQTVSADEIGFTKMVEDRDHRGEGGGAEVASGKFLVCRRCYARCTSRLSPFHSLANVRNRAAHMLVASFLPPLDIGRLSTLNSEWHGLMVSKIADAAIWRPLCRLNLGRVLTSTEYREHLLGRSSHNSMPPHQDMYMRHVILESNATVAAACLSNPDVSIVLSAAKALMRHFMTISTVGTNPSKSIAAIGPLVKLISAYLLQRKGRTSAVTSTGSFDQGKDTLLHAHACVVDEDTAVEVLTHATGALMNGSLLNDDARKEIIRLEGLQLMFSVLEFNGGNFNKLTKYASGTLWNLCVQDRCCRPLVREHLEGLVGMVRSYWAKSASANGAARQMAGLNPVNPEDDLAYSIAVDANSDATALSCIGTIASCCNENYHDNQIALVQAGGVVAVTLLVRSLSERYLTSQKKKIVISCCSALQNVVIKQPRAQKVFRESEGVALMMKVMGSSPDGDACDPAVAKAALAVLMNCTAEDRQSCQEVDMAALVKRVSASVGTSAIAMGLTGVLQNITVQSPRVESPVCTMLVECTRMYGELVKYHGCETVMGVAEPAKVKTDSSETSICTCLSRLMCSLQNLCLNRRNHPLLLAAGAVELAKNVIVHVTKSPNPRYHATKIIDILEKRRMGKKCSKESEANA